MDEDELSENNDEDEEESDEEEADKNDEEDDEEGDEEDEEDDDADENENEDNERPKKKSKLGETDDNLQIFSSDRTEEIEKGKVVRSQLSKLNSIFSRKPFYLVIHSNFNSIRIMGNAIRNSSQITEPFESSQSVSSA